MILAIAGVIVSGLFVAHWVGVWGCAGSVNVDDCQKGTLVMVGLFWILCGTQILFDNWKK